MITEQSSRSKICPGDLVARKPDEAFLWRQEMGNCSYDYTTQTRHWDDSDVMRAMIMSTGSPSSSTMFDGEAEE